MASKEEPMYVIIRRCNATQHGDIYPQCVCGLINKKVRIKKLHEKILTREPTPAEKKTVWKTGPLYNYSGNGRAYNVISRTEFVEEERKP